MKDRARAGVDRGVLGCLVGVLALGDVTSRARAGVGPGEVFWPLRVGGVAGVRPPRCVGGVRAHGDVAGLGVRGWLPALAGRAAPVWRSRNGVRGGSIVARLWRGRQLWRVEPVPRRPAAAQVELLARAGSLAAPAALSGVDTMSVVLYRFV